MFNTYHQPSFIYGTDTMSINEMDLERLERKYRQVLRHMMSLPRYTKSSLIYLAIGVLPARAQRDLEILGVFGQLAICDDEKQEIRKVMKNSLTFYDINFTGWSGLVRKTCLKYDLPDPLQVMLHPWRPDRWREYCKQKIIIFWENYLKSNLVNSEQAVLIDVEKLSLSKPMQLWDQAGLDSLDVRKTTISSWMLMGIYQTKEKLKDMKLSKSAQCPGCSNLSESLEHIIFHCSFYQKIRETYLPKFLNMNTKLVSVLQSKFLTLLSILDPGSSKLPHEVRDSWTCLKSAYANSRNFCYDVHMKRTKLLEKQQT